MRVVRLRRFVVAALVAVGPASLAGQVPAACTGADLPVAGEGADTLYVAVGRAAGGPAVASVVAATTADAVADAFRLPAGVSWATVDMVGRRVGGGPGVTRPAVGVTLVVGLRRDGTVQDVRVSQRSLADGLDGALARGVRAADSARALVPREGGPATLPVAVRLTLRPDTGETARPVAVLRQPRYAPAENARLLGTLPTPGGADARDGISNRASGGVGVAFEVVVDGSGRPVPGTERLVDFNNPTYAVQVFDWLRHEARFAPARVGGCPVRQLLWWGVRTETLPF